MDGHAIACPASLVGLLPALCDAPAQGPILDTICQVLLSDGDDGAALLARLYNQGSLLPDLDEEDDE